ncbi:hypothetical protein ZWY2020_034527 [Hordeum vulgare]|nr:hypothetical protein ZWY2020_034527 [Hordeum vulgare]
MEISSSRRIEQFGNLGRQFRDMLTCSGFDKDPEVSGHSYHTIGGEERYRIKLVLYPRMEQTRGYRFTDNGEDFMDAVIRVVHKAMHEIAGVHQDELKHTPFRYFTFRIGDGAVRKNLKYMDEDDPTIIRMASLIYGVEQNLVITTHMLEENRRRLEFYQARVETLEERLVEANTSLVAAHEARVAIEVAAEQAITAANVVLSMDNGDQQEIPPEDPTPTPRERLHPRMMITRTKKSILAKRRRLTLRAIAPSAPPTLPTPPTREEQLGDLEEETEPEERVPATPEGTSSP